MPTSGDLTAWAGQGVFLLNASLTVRQGEPMSHAQIGWATFTDSVIKLLSEKRQQLVFMLWGKFAKEKKGLIDSHKHLILTAAHPSPLSAHQGFLGCKHFSAANQYLAKMGIDPINWHV
jgi:uracil-DNA glycosylase